MYNQIYFRFRYAYLPNYKHSFIYSLVQDILYYNNKIIVFLRVYFRTAFA